MSAAEIVCLSLMLVAVLGGAVADWAYAREIEKDLDEDLDYQRRIRETYRALSGVEPTWYPPVPPAGADAADGGM